MGAGFDVVGGGEFALGNEDAEGGFEFGLIGDGAAPGGDEFEEVFA